MQTVLDSWMEKALGPRLTGRGVIYSQPQLARVPRLGDKWIWSSILMDEVQYADVFESCFSTLTPSPLLVGALTAASQCLLGMVPLLSLLDGTQTTDVPQSIRFGMATNNPLLPHLDGTQTTDVPQSGKDGLATCTPPLLLLDGVQTTDAPQRVLIQVFIH